MIEDCLKELRTSIQTDLPALLNAEDAEYAAADVVEFGAGEAIVLDDIDTVRFELYAEHEVQEYPAIILLPVGLEEDPFMHDQGRYAWTIDCVIMVRDTRPVRVARRLFRTVEAFRRMLTTNVEGGGTAENPIYQVDLLNVGFGPLVDEPGGLTKGATVTIRVHEIEGRP